MNDAICPDCGSKRLRRTGQLPDVAFFAGQRAWSGRVDAWAAAPTLRRDQQLVQTALQQAVEAGARSVLDFGCYSGDFLAALPDTLRKFGVEVNAAAAAVAAQRAGARVERALESFGDAQRFDVRHHAAVLHAPVREVRRFAYLGREQLPGFVGRWKPMLRHLLAPAAHMRRQQRHFEQHGTDLGVPGIGLTRDHLLLVIGRDG
jgi:SAM-dependent methyltransferase